MNLSRTFLKKFLLFQNSCKFSQRSIPELSLKASQTSKFGKSPIRPDLFDLVKQLFHFFQIFDFFQINQTSKIAPSLNHLANFIACSRLRKDAHNEPFLSLCKPFFHFFSIHFTTPNTPITYIPIFF